MQSGLEKTVPMLVDDDEADDDGGGELVRPRSDQMNKSLILTLDS